MAHAWDREYTTPTFTSFSDRPHKDVVEFFRTLKKEFQYDPYQKTLLDIGCGIGKDMAYAHEILGMQAFGFDSSLVAIEKVNHADVGSACVHDASNPWSYADTFFDVGIDHMTLHCLDTRGRENYAREISRVLKPGGFVFIKTFARKGDGNAQQLLRNFPAGEDGSYLHPDLGILEHVFTEEELRTMFGTQFTILKLVRDMGYQKWGKQSYKRYYWLLMMQKI